MEKLTVKQAIEQGYTHAGTQNAFESGVGTIKRLTRMHATDFEDEEWQVCAKEMQKFWISDTLLFELLTEYLEVQDEVADENGDLIDIAAKADFSGITNQLNELFAVKSYYAPTDIQLVSDKEAAGDGK